MAFRQNVEVNQHVAAENYIYTLHERHAGVIEEVEARERNAASQSGRNPQLIVSGIEIFLPVVGREIARAVVPVNAVLAVSERSFVQVSR